MDITTSQQNLGMRKKMAMVQKQLDAFCTTISSALQVRGVTSMGFGEGPPRQSPCNKKPTVGHNSSIGQKHAFKPGSYVTKPSGTDLEKLRKQIETKENELKLQRHIRLGKGQDTRSIPSGTFHTVGIADSTTMSSRRQNYVSPTFSKLTEGAPVKEINEEKQKIPNVILQELEPSFKDSMSSLQQQRWKIPNVDIDHSCTKDGSRNEVFTRELHAGLKEEDEPMNWRNTHL